MEGDEEDDITYILRKRRFYLASDAQSDSEEEEDGKSTSEFATAVEVEDRDAEGSTAKPVVVTRRTVGIQPSDVVTQI